MKSFHACSLVRLWIQLSIRSMSILVYICQCRGQLKCDGTRRTRFRLSTKRTSPFKSAGASVPSTTGSRGVRISVSNAGYPLHSPVSPSLPLPCVTVCHRISIGVGCGFIVRRFGHSNNWLLRQLRFIFMAG